MDSKVTRFTLRIDRWLFRKFRYIAKPELRSANRAIEQCIKKRVAEYEKEHGAIPVAPEK